MESIGEKITDDEVKEMIREVDLDGDGRLNYDEFAKVMMANPKRKKKRKRFCSARMTDEEHNDGFITEAEIRFVMTRDGSKVTDDEVKDAIRADNDGFITEAELRYVLTRSGANITEDDVKNAIKAADVDGDGRLSYDDFVKYKMAMKMIEEAPKGKNLVMQRIVNIFRAFVKHDLGFCVFDKSEIVSEFSESASFNLVILLPLSISWYQTRTFLQLCLIDDATKEATYRRWCQSRGSNSRMG
ncbi:unnamed protein product [Thlaspi arvense]|uniref:EF-hand domain-containing protein n=1 Tax=Thlaspi arvense TaxID=13288 RepID=A0AAU9T8L0_THLAR|nr:unnamed protein product [Thlaspi arvense]